MLSVEYKTEKERTKLKGSLPRDLKHQVFLQISFHLAPDYPIGAISNFYEIRRDFRNVVFIAGVNDTLYHRVNRVATATFWRTFSDEGKISPSW
jgi:hypothetical protein